MFGCLLTRILHTQQGGPNDVRDFLFWNHPISAFIAGSDIRLTLSQIPADSTCLPLAPS